MEGTARAVPVTIGLDIPKSSFQVHAIGAGGQVVLRRKLSRGEDIRCFKAQPKMLCGIEACGTGRFWYVRSPRSRMWCSCYRPLTRRPTPSAPEPAPRIGTETL